MQNPTSIVLMTLASMCAASIATAGQVENMMNFQARLTNDQSAALSGNHTLDFFFYGADTGGPIIGSILNVAVTIPANANGVVSMPIGPVQDAWFNDAPRYLGMTIDDNDDDPTGNELSPRIRLTAVPFAMRAFNVPTTTILDIQSASISGSLSVGGNLGVGTSSPSYRVEVRAPTLSLADFQGVNRGGLGIVANGSNLAGLDFNATSFADRPLARIAASIDTAGNGTSALLFGTSSNLNSGVTRTAMTIDGDGFVGIGTTVPTEKLEVYNANIAMRRFDENPVGDRLIRFSTRNQTGGEMQDWGIGAFPVPGRYNVNQHVCDFWIGSRVGTSPYEKTFNINQYGVGIRRDAGAALDVYSGSAESWAAVRITKHSDLGNPNRTAFQVIGAVTDISPKQFKIYTEGEPWFLKCLMEGDMRVDGNVGIGRDPSSHQLDVNGTTRTKVLTITGGSDLAEPFAMSDAHDGTSALPGMVMVIDPKNPGQLMLATEAYDKKVAGVISGANGLNPGMVMKAEGQPHADGEHNIALTGRVWCWCDATMETGGGAITPGDRLTTSATPGHAMKVTDESKAPGAVVGKAMTELKEDRGLVLVLVNLQ